MKWLAALCCAWLSASAQAQPDLLPVVPPVPLPTGQVIAIGTDFSPRLSTPVAIGGKLWNFLIDTASTRSVIASEVADSLELSKGDALQILNIAGIDTVPSVVIPDLRFSDLVVRDIHAPALLRGNLGGDGLLGLDVLHDSRISIDFEHATTLTISPSSRQSHRASDHIDPDTIVVVARSRMGELVITHADIDGVPVVVILDTGSEESIGNPALARLLRRGATRATLLPVTFVSVTGRTLVADYARVDKLKIGDVTIGNVPLAFGDLATFRQFGLSRRPAILLGMRTLRLFAMVTIDFPRREIRFRLRDVLAHDRSRHDPA